MKFFPEAFEAAGYFTANIGKIEHKQHQDSMKVDVFSNPQDSFPKSAIVEQGKVGDWGPYQKVDAPDEQFGDGAIADRIVALIEKKAGGKEPLFLHAGFHKPHQPWVGPLSIRESKAAASSTQGARRANTSNSTLASRKSFINGIFRPDAADTLFRPSQEATGP